MNSPGSWPSSRSGGGPAGQSPPEERTGGSLSAGQSRVSGCLVPRPRHAPCEGCINATHSVHLSEFSPERASARHRPVRTEIIRGNRQFLQADAAIIPHVRSRPLPSTSFPIHFPLSPNHSNVFSVTHRHHHYISHKQIKNQSKQLMSK
jgi:hypothetical protein